MRNQAIEYPARGEMTLLDVGPPPALAPTQVLLETLFTGITNGTERHALLAEHFWGVFPSRHGYQHVAVVSAVGGSVASYAPGDLVFYGDYVGHRGWNVVDAGRPHLCARLPSCDEVWPYALLGVAGVAMRGVRRCRVAAAENVWVSGQGLIGQFAAQAARAVGARVTVTDINAARLDLSRTLGAHVALDARDAGTDAALQAGGPYECIIDCAGAASFFPQLGRDRLLAPHGRIGLLAVRTNTTFNWGMLHAGIEGSIEVSCHFDADDLRVLLHFVGQEIIRTKLLISHVVSIDEAPRIYETLRDRPGDLLGVVFDWRG